MRRVLLSGRLHGQRMETSSIPTQRLQDQHHNAGRSKDDDDYYVAPRSGLIVGRWRDGNKRAPR
jgi:hypothetical protein